MPWGQSASTIPQPPARGFRPPRANSVPCSFSPGLSAEPAPPAGRPGEQSRRWPPQPETSRKQGGNGSGGPPPLCPPRTGAAGSFFPPAAPGLGAPRCGPHHCLPSSLQSALRRPARRLLSSALTNSFLFVPKGTLSGVAVTPQPVSRLAVSLQIHLSAEAGGSREPCAGGVLVGPTKMLLPGQHPSALPCLGRGPRSISGVREVTSPGFGDSQHPACPDSVSPWTNMGQCMGQDTCRRTDRSCLSLSLPRPLLLRGTSPSAQIRRAQCDALSHQLCHRHLLPCAEAGRISDCQWGSTSANEALASAHSLPSGEVMWLIPWMGCQQDWGRRSLWQ